MQMCNDFKDKHQLSKGFTWSSEKVYYMVFSYILCVSNVYIPYIDASWNVNSVLFSIFGELQIET